jgi:hypothetical protein
MVGSGSSGNGGGEGFTGRAAIGYDHGYDGEIFYLGLALDERYVEGWVEGCLERIGEDDPDEELLFRDLWEDETQREVVIIGPLAGEDPAVGILPHLDEDFFQALPDEITARGGAKASDGGPRRAIFCPDPAAQPGQAGFRGQGRYAHG